ncbi:MAG: hypothetical protein JWP91_3877 [Fibrobacteres bacterium]|nr:hypothetical protein [Fibrobacterota bacterium]
MEIREGSGNESQASGQAVNCCGPDCCRSVAEAQGEIASLKQSVQELLAAVFGRAESASCGCSPLCCAGDIQVNVRVERLAPEKRAYACC